MQETWVQPLGQEDPREEGVATHSSVLAWRIPWTEEPGRLQSTGSQSQTRLTDGHTHEQRPTACLLTPTQRPSSQHNLLGPQSLCEHHYGSQLKCSGSIFERALFIQQTAIYLKCLSFFPGVLKHFSYQSSIWKYSF